jgi:uncharacterized cofD-like protein
VSVIEPIPTVPPAVVAIGGGHGLSRSLAALRLMQARTTAIVAMADDGGSSGRLRRSLGVLPPGDLRKALSSLLPDLELAAWLEHRFADGELAGHSLGNLMMIGLQEVRGGDLVGALDRLGAILGAHGRVLPSTVDAIELVADGPDGQVRGQAAIARSSGHRRVHLDPSDVTATPEAVQAIMEADLVVLGPGSLFTSILPNLLVPDIGEALRATTARRVLVANLREQPGETSGLTLADHLDIIADHLPGLTVDVLLVHHGAAPTGPGAPLRAPDTHEVVDRVITAELLDGDDAHDPTALASAFRQIAGSVTRAPSEA